MKHNIDKIWGKNPVYQHGDYHLGNLIYTKDGTIGVIDFNRLEVGDLYEEHLKIMMIFGDSFPNGIQITQSYRGFRVEEK